MTAERASRPQPLSIDATIQRFNLVLLLILIFLGPLIRLSTVKSGFYLPKITLLQSVIILLLAGWLFKFLFGQSSVKHTVVDLPLGIFLVLATVSAFTSVYPIGSFFGQYNVGDGLVALICYLVLFFTAASIDWDNKRIQLLIRVLMASVALIVLAGILQFFGYDRPVGGLGLSAGRRIGSTLGNADFLGAYLSLVLPVILIQYVALRKRWQIGVVLVLILALLIALLLTGSRAAWLGGFIGLIFCLILLGKDYLRIRKGRLVLLVIILLALSLTKSGQQQVRSAFIRIATTGQPTRLSDVYRIENVKIALKVIKERPLLGWGPGSYEYGFDKYATFKIAQTEPLRPTIDVHNFILHTLATIGLPASLFLLSALFLFFLWGYRTVINLTLQDGLVVKAFLAGTLGYFIAIQFIPSFFGATFLFWIFIGIILSFRPLSTAMLNYKLSAGAKTVGAVFIILVTIFLVTFSIRFYLADVHYKRGVLFGMNQDVARMQEEYTRMIELNPYVEEYYESFARSYQKQFTETGGAPYYIERAIQKYQEAIKLNKARTAGYNRLGIAYATGGETLGTKTYYLNALAAFREAAKLRPLSANIQNNLGYTYWRLGEYRKAIAELELAVKINPDMVSAYYLLGESYEKVGQRARALSAYRQALEIRPDFEEARKALERLEDK